MSALKLKLIFVGHGRVGKTSLINQYLDKTFKEEYIMTVGKEKSLKNINIEGKEVSLEICDTAGQPDYRAINKIFMKNTDIALIVYDITKRESFEELNNWIGSVKESNTNKKVIFGIAANKSDLYEQRVVKKNEGEELAKNNNALFFETSAKDYDSVENVFLTLSEEYLKKEEERKKEEEKKKKKKKKKKNEEEEKKRELELIQKKIDDNNHCSSKCSIM
jgi:small GTP-binding protein